MRSQIHRILGWLALSLAATLSAHAQNILCTCSGNYFDRPGDCRRSCRNRLTCNGCMVSDKHCDLLANRNFKILYNNAVFGTVAGRLPAARTAAVNAIVDTFYPPRRHTELTTSLGASEGGGDEWAHVMPGPRGGLPSLVVSPDAFQISPAGLISAIGHEMIHIEQLKRPHAIFSNINSAVDAFRELEASSWETGEGSAFHWSIGPNRAWNCIPADEQEAPKLVRRCRDWQVKKAIENGMTGMRSATVAKELEAWIRAEPWANTVWLPQHTNWKTIRAGARPDNMCPNP